MTTRHLKGTLPFMVCGTPDCGWLGVSWNVIDTLTSCPKCHVDESGIAGILDPNQLVGRTAKLRDLTVKLMEYYGGNTFSAMRPDGVLVTVSVLQLRDIDLPSFQEQPRLDNPS